MVLLQKKKKIETQRRQVKYFLRVLKKTLEIAVYSILSLLHLCFLLCMNKRALSTLQFTVLN